MHVPVKNGKLKWSNKLLSIFSTISMNLTLDDIIFKSSNKKHPQSIVASNSTLRQKKAYISLK